MTFRYKNLYRGVVNGTIQTVYGPLPANASRALARVHCSVGPGGPGILEVWIVPNGGTPSDANCIFNQVDVPASQTRGGVFDATCFEVMDVQGITIQARLNGSLRACLTLNGASWE